MLNHYFFLFLHRIFVSGRVSEATCMAAAIRHLNHWWETIKTNLLFVTIIDGFWCGKVVKWTSPTTDNNDTSGLVSGYQTQAQSIDPVVNWFEVRINHSIRWNHIPYVYLIFSLCDYILLVHITHHVKAMDMGNYNKINGTILRTISSLLCTLLSHLFWFT